MDNNVINAICEALTARSILSLKFNFRGVGGSEGTFRDGKDELSDVNAAISFVETQKEIDRGRIGLAGYSAGSAWGLTTGCQDARIKAMAGISPPLSMFNFSCLEKCSKPKLMISGTEDNLIPVTPFQSFCNTLPDIKECHTIEGADHLWWGFESNIAKIVADFFKRTL
jgi:uncharacterized protein